MRFRQDEEGEILDDGEVSGMVPGPEGRKTVKEREKERRQRRNKLTVRERLCGTRKLDLVKTETENESDKRNRKWVQERKGNNKKGNNGHVGAEGMSSRLMIE